MSITVIEFRNNLNEVVEVVPTKQMTSKKFLEMRSKYKAYGRTIKEGH